MFKTEIWQTYDGNNKHFFFSFMNPKLCSDYRLAHLVNGSHQELVCKRTFDKEKKKKNDTKK